MKAILEPHKEHLTTVAHWNTYRKEQINAKLPSAQTLIRHYGSWNKVKEDFGFERTVTYTDIQQMPEEHVLALLQPHKDHLMRTRSQWEKHIVESAESLPTSASLITYFGTWNRLKELLGLSTAPEHRPPTYSKEDIIQIVKQYLPISLSPRKWDAFRKEQHMNLPSSQTISKYLTKEEKELLKQL